MASISSLMGSSSGTSSIYGNRNIISGLASGMDTELMIENCVKGYQAKIAQLQQQQTKITWKQDAYRDITDKLISLSQKYTSYTSKTNLSSPSFFLNAVNTLTNGSNASKVSATGRTNSEIKLNAVKQLASAARYSVDAKAMNTKEQAIGSAVDFDQKVQLTKLSGDITLTVGREKVTLSFAEDEIIKDADELTKAINKKLSEQEVGKATADTMVRAVNNGGTISFETIGDAKADGDAVWISSAYGDIKDTLGITDGALGKGDTALKTSGTELYEELDRKKYLSGQSIAIQIGDKTTRVVLGDLTKSDDPVKDIVETMQKQVDKAFGEGKLAISVNDEGSFVFTPEKDGEEIPTVTVSSAAGTALGFGTNGLSNAVTTNSTLLQTFGSNLDALRSETVDKDGNKVMSDPDFSLTINGVKIGPIDKNSTISDILSKINSSDAGVKASYSKLTNKFVLTANETGAAGRIDVGGKLGEALFGKTEVGKAEVYTNESGLVTDSDGNALIGGYNDDGEAYYIHARADKDGNMKYYMASANGRPLSKDDLSVDSIADVLQQARKGFEAGKDAIVNATVNGDNITLTRSSNVIEMDGMTVTISDTFNNDKDANGVSFFNADGSWNKNAKVEADSVVTFTTKADADKIIEAVQGFIKEFNELATQVRSEYSTQPLKDANKRRYEPLTDADKEDLSESQIKAYEEKAKTGLLFGDTDLSGLHNALRSGITPSGAVRGAMTEIGLTTKYENGVTTLSLDEDKFRAALEKNPDEVHKVFTASKENGDSYDGLMARAKSTINTYASTSIGSYGVLVNKAGTKSKSLTLMNNTLQKKYNSLEEQIERWQTKMSDKVDYYTRQFTQLEKLMNEMNSQSSALAGLMGGY